MSTFPLVSALVGVTSVVVSLCFYLTLPGHKIHTSERNLPLLSELGMQAPERYSMAFGGSIASILAIISIIKFGSIENPCAKDGLDEFFDTLCLSKLAETASVFGVIAGVGLNIAALIDANTCDQIHSLAAKVFFLAAVPWALLTTILARRRRYSSFHLKYVLCLAIVVAFCGFPAFVLIRVGPKKIKETSHRPDFRADALLLVGDARPAFEYVLGFLFAAFLATLSLDLDQSASRRNTTMMVEGRQSLVSSSSKLNNTSPYI